MTEIRDRKWRVCPLPLPPFHQFGFFIQVMYPLFGCICVSMFPPVVQKPGDLPITATPDLVLKHAIRTKADVLFCVPTFLQAWAQSPKAVQVLKTIPFVVRISESHTAAMCLNTVQDFQWWTPSPKSRNLLDIPRSQCQNWVRRDRVWCSCPPHL